MEGTFVHFDELYTFDELQRRLSSCQIDSTWKFSPERGKRPLPLVELRDDGRSLDFRCKVAVVVHLAEIERAEHKQELDRIRSALNRRGIHHRVVYRAPASYYGGEYAVKELRLDAGETWLGDCDTVYLLGNDVADLLNADLVKAEPGLDQALLTPLRQNCVGDPSKAKPLRYISWDHKRTHRSIPEDLKKVVNRKEVPYKLRSIVNRVEREIINGSSAPWAIVLVGFVTLIAAGLIAIVAILKSSETRVSTRATVSVNAGQSYQLEVITTGPVVSSKIERYPFQCGDESSIAAAWKRLLDDANTLNAKESDIPRERLAAGCPDQSPSELLNEIVRITPYCDYYLLELVKQRNSKPTLVRTYSFDRRLPESVELAWKKLVSEAVLLKIPFNTLPQDRISLPSDCEPTPAERASSLGSFESMLLMKDDNGADSTALREQINREGLRAVTGVVGDLSLLSEDRRNDPVLLWLDSSMGAVICRSRPGTSSGYHFDWPKTSPFLSGLNIRRDSEKWTRDLKDNDQDLATSDWTRELTAVKGQAVEYFVAAYWRPLEDRTVNNSVLQDARSLLLVGLIPQAIAELDGRAPTSLRNYLRDPKILEDAWKTLCESSGSFEAVRGARAAANRRVAPGQLAVAIGYVESLRTQIEKSDTVFRQIKTTKELLYDPVLNQRLTGATPSE